MKCLKGCIFGVVMGVLVGAIIGATNCDMVQDTIRKGQREFKRFRRKYNLA